MILLVAVLTPPRDPGGGVQTLSALLLDTPHKGAFTPVPPPIHIPRLVLFAPEWAGGGNNGGGTRYGYCVLAVEPPPLVGFCCSTPR